MAGTGNRATSQMITLGIFLKLLGFFVVMFTYAEFEPIKVKQAEYSLQQRFNIALPLPDLKSGDDALNLYPVQALGRSFHTLDTELQTELDFLSSKRNAETNELVLELRADQILDLGGKPAKSQNFAVVLTQALKANTPAGHVFHLDIVTKGGAPDDMMRGAGLFVQKMIVAGFPQKSLMIGHESASKPSVKLVVRAVPR